MITMYGADWCGDCRRAKAHFDANNVQYEYLDVAADGELADKAREISGRTNIPVVVFPDGAHLVEPSNAELDAKLSGLGIR